MCVFSDYGTFEFEKAGLNLGDGSSKFYIFFVTITGGNSKYPPSFQTATQSPYYFESKKVFLDIMLINSISSQYIFHTHLRYSKIGSKGKYPGLWPIIFESWLLILSFSSGNHTQNEMQKWYFFTYEVIVKTVTMLQEIFPWKLSSLF